MINQIVMSKIVDNETSKGIIARTIYTEDEMDNLARTLSGSAGKTIINKYWEGESKTYVLEDVVVPEEPELPPVEVEVMPEVKEETPIELTHAEFEKIKSKKRK